MAICTALSGPLYQRLGVQASGYGFTGGSTNGKTISLSCGTSVWGSSEEMMQTWNNTALRLENLAMQHTGTFLPLDEMSKLDPDLANEIMYNLSSGKTRGGMNRENDKARPEHHWNTIFFSTSERTLDDILKNGKKSVNAGEEVRFVEIPMNVKGTDRGFEHGGEFEFDESIKNPIKAILYHLKRTTTEYYGSAGDAMVEHLLLLTEEEWDELRQWKTDWSNSHTPANCDNQVQRIVEKFAMSALAGELAVAWGIVPWTSSGVEWAITACLEAWFIFRGNTNRGEVNKGVENLLSFIDTKSARFRPLSTAIESIEKIHNMAGWMSSSLNPEYYYFNASAWKEMAYTPNKLNPKNLCTDLRSKKILVWDESKDKDYKDKRMGIDGVKMVRIIDKVALDWFMKHNRTITAQERATEAQNYGGFDE